jgi:hypothetical protein
MCQPLCLTDAPASQHTARAPAFTNTRRRMIPGVMHSKIATGTTTISSAIQA